MDSWTLEEWEMWERGTKHPLISRIYIYEHCFLIRESSGSAERYARNAQLLQGLTETKSFSGDTS